MRRVDKDNPCKPDCPDRCADPNCHMTCEKHLKWKQEVEEDKKKIKEYYQINGIKSTKMFTNKAIHIYKKYHNKRKDGY